MLSIRKWILQVLFPACGWHDHTLWLCDRERPKYQIKEEDLETPRNVSRGIGEGSDTVKVARDVRGEENNRPR